MTEAFFSFISLLPIVYIICAVENWQCIVMHYKSYQLWYDTVLSSIHYYSLAPWLKALHFYLSKNQVKM